jgi:hypothetical protein
VKRAFADLNKLEKWVDHYCRYDCDRPRESIAELRGELELLRMMDTTKHTYRPAAMSAPAFEALACAVRDSHYDARRVEALRLEARSGWFSAAQVRRLLELVDYEGNRMLALEALAPRVVDLENRMVILGVFEYDATRARAHALLAGIPGATTVAVPF